MSIVADGGRGSGPTFHEEILQPGRMWSRRMRRNQALELTDTVGRGCVAALFYNADDPIERYNMPDTLKGQFTACLTKGHALHSDMGHVLCSIVEDTCGWHDTFTGALDGTAARSRYGDGSYQTLRNDYVRNARDNFLTELGKHGLGKRDVIANVNFFVKVTVSEDGTLSFAANHSTPGAAVTLRMDMNVLVVLSNTPHPLDSRTSYAPTPVKLRLFEIGPRPEDDVVFHHRPENARAFALTDLYFA